MQRILNVTPYAGNLGISHVSLFGVLMSRLSFKANGRAIGRVSAIGGMMNTARPGLIMRLRVQLIEVNARDGLLCLDLGSECSCWYAGGSTF